MSKRDKLSGLDPFSRGDEDAPSLRDVDTELFGGLSQVDAGREVIKPVRVFDIVPDLSQPRRALPSAVRAGWSGDPAVMRVLFERWLELVQQERGSAFVLDVYLLAEGENERPEQIGPLETALVELLELAASIRREGLTNPVTVTRVGRQYRLETGERRWLAHLLLHLWEQDETQRARWEKIPARLVPELNVWRQASENAARANLNAVARARQLAVLLMDIYRQRGQQFRSYEEVLAAGQSERLFYAQVAGENVPRGLGDLMLSAMGLKHIRQISYYRQLLNLPDEAWRLADDYNLTENALRECRAQAGEDAELLVRLVHQAAYELGDSGTTVPATGHEAAAAPPRKRPARAPQNPLLTRQELRAVTRGIRLASTLELQDLGRLQKSKKKKMRELSELFRRLAAAIENGLDEGDTDED